MGKHRAGLETVQRERLPKLCPGRPLTMAINYTKNGLPL